MTPTESAASTLVLGIGVTARFPGDRNARLAQQVGAGRDARRGARVASVPLVAVKSAVTQGYGCRGSPQRGRALRGHEVLPAEPRARRGGFRAWR